MNTMQQPELINMDNLLLSNIDDAKFYVRSNKSSIFGKLRYKFPSLEKHDKLFPLKNDMFSPDFKERSFSLKFNGVSKLKKPFEVAMQSVLLDEDNINKKKYVRQFPSFSFKTYDRPIRAHRKIGLNIDYYNEKLHDSGDQFFKEIENELQEKNFKIKNFKPLKLEKVKKNKDDLFMTEGYTKTDLPRISLKRGRSFENQNKKKREFGNKPLLAYLNKERNINLKILSPRNKNAIITQINGLCLRKIQRDKNYKNISQLNEKVMDAMKVNY